MRTSASLHNAIMWFPLGILERLPIRTQASTEIDNDPKIPMFRSLQTHGNYNIFIYRYRNTA